MALTKPRAYQIYDIDYKQAVRAISLTDVNLAGGAPSQVDGINLSVNDRILVAGQDPATENGIYFVSVLGSGENGTWVRSTDTNSTGELLSGTVVMVTEGETYADTQWKLITNGEIVIGTTPLTFEQNTGDSFGNIYANGTAILANSVSGSITFASGNGIQIIGNNTTKTVTIASTGSLATTDIANGNSNVSITTSGGNVTVSVGGISNVATFTTANVITAANLLPASNVTYSLGSSDNRWKDLWVANNSIYLGEVTIGTVGSTLTVNGANVLTGNAGSNFSTSGNVVGGNILTSGAVSATGNVTGNYIIGNGSQLTGLPAGYSNANAASFMAEFGSNTISTTGTITAGNITGNNLLTAGLISSTGNITGGNVLATNLTGTLLTSSQTNITSVGTLESLSVTGTVTGGNISAINLSGSLTTNEQGNITSVGTLTSLNSGAISSSGNVTASNLITGGSITAAGNIQSGNILTSGLITATGTITGGNIATAGTITATGNLVAGNVSATNLTGTLLTASQPNITAVGTLSSLSVTGTVTGGNIATAGTVSATGTITGANITGGNLLTPGVVSASGNLFANNAVLAGNLQVNGNITYINSNVVTINDVAINLGNNASNVTQVNNGGLELGPQGSPYVTFLYNSSANTWTSSAGLSAVANVVGGNLITGGLISATGNVIGGNVITLGNVGIGTASPAGLLQIASSQGNVTVRDLSSQTSSTDIGIVFDGTGNLKSGMFTEVNGNILSYGINVRQIDSAYNEALSGGIFRLDTRSGNAFGDAGCFVVKARSAGSNVEFSSIVIDFNSGNTVLSPFKGNVGVGNVPAPAYQLHVNGSAFANSFLTSGAISATGNITGGNILFGSGGVIGTGNVNAQNITASGASGRVAMATDAGGSINMGRLDGVASSPYIDFNTSATGVDYDVRLQATGNAGTQGGGTLTITAATVAATAILSAAGNIQGGNLRTTGLISSTGNVTGGNILTAGLISVTGNISGGNLNITGNIIDTGPLSIITGSNGNIALTPNGTGIVTVSSALSAVGNIDSGNLRTTGLISATGNVSGNNFVVGISSLGTVSTTAGWYFETSFSVAGQDTEPRGVDFKSDGTRMYVVGQTGDDIIQYDLGTAWDVSTAVYGNAFVVSAQSTSPFDVSLGDGGTKMYVLDGNNDTVFQYTLSTPWDVGTATYASLSFSVSGQEATPTGMWFRPDGTKFFVVGNTGDDINEYNLGTAWNISTASFVTQSASFSIYETTPVGVAFSDDGLRAWIVGPGYNRITQFDLSVAWDVSTLAFNSYLPIAGSGNLLVLGSSGLYVNTTAGVAYVSDYQNDRIFQYATDTPTGQLAGPQWTAQTDLNVGQNLAVNGNLWGGQQARFVSSVTASGFNSTNFATSSATATNSLLTGVTTGAVNFGTAMTSGILTIGGTLGTGAINIGRSTANQSIIIGNGVTGSGNVKTIDIGTLGAAGSNTNINIGSTTANSVTTIRIAGNIINGQANGVGNIGNATGYFNTIFARATSAQYADLAEIYVADVTYAPGTLVEFGGTNEVTITTQSHSTRIAGIVSTNPSYLMNATQNSDTAVPVALTGRVPCSVVGNIAKGDRLVASDIPGVATVLELNKYQPACIVGKALENYNSDQPGTIEVAVGRT